MAIKAVIFDACGVLYKRKAQTAKIEAAFLNKNRWNISVDDLAGAWLKVKKKSYKGRLGRNEAFRKKLSLVGVFLGKKMFEKYMAIWKSAKAKNITANAGVKGALKKIKELGLKTACYSDTMHTRKEKEDIFRKVGIETLIDKTFCSCEIGFVKSERKGWNIVLRELGIKSNEAVFVGHQKHEIQGARRRGLYAISFTKGIGENKFVRNFSELANIIEKLNKAKAEPLLSVHSSQSAEKSHANAGNNEHKK